MLHFLKVSGKCGYRGIIEVVPQTEPNAWKEPRAAVLPVDGTQPGQDEACGREWILESALRC